MTLPELYAAVGGSYEQAQKVMRMDKLIDKHIRKFPNNPVYGLLSSAGESMDASGLFEHGHALKGVCANLGLIELSKAADVITEEFRPGNARKMSDDEVREQLRKIGELYQRAIEGIREYEKE